MAFRLADVTAKNFEEKLCVAREARGARMRRHHASQYEQARWEGKGGTTARVKRRRTDGKKGGGMQMHERGPSGTASNSLYHSRFFVTVFPSL